MKLAALVLLTAAGLSAQPRLTNAKLETRSITGPLAAAVRALPPGPLWLGYSVPAASKWSNRCQCRLESGYMTSSGGAPAMFFFRITNGAVERMQWVSEDCEVDAGNMPVIWLTGVKPAESLEWLLAMRTTLKGDSAIAAVAAHAGPEADRALIDIARNDAKGQSRGNALFWLAQRASDKALQTITGAMDNDPDTEVKKKAVFALYNMPRDEGVPHLINVARTHKNPQVRKQAFFWLGQTKDDRAFRFFEEILTH